MIQAKTPIQVFEKDKNPNVSGDDYIIYEAVNSFFKREQWQTASEEFESFLRTNHGENVTARANFYLGQCYLFLGKHQESLNCFLASEKMYPAESKKWIKIVIDDFPLPPSLQKKTPVSIQR